MDAGEDDNAASLGNLPPELIDLIFSFLSYEDRIAVERTCSRWRQVNECEVWRIDETVVIGRDRCRGCADPSDRFRSFLERHGFRIRRLKFSFLVMSEECFRLAAALCHNVEMLTMSYSILHEECARYVKRLGEKLRELTVIGCGYEVMEGGMLSLYCEVFNGCPNLRHLHLENLFHLESITHASPLPNLRELRLEGMQLIHLSLNCPNLQQLFLKRCTKLTNADVNGLLCSAGRTLRKLEINSCRLSAGGLQNGLRRCTSLTDVSVGDLLARAKTLKLLCEASGQSLRFLRLARASVLNFQPLLRCSALFELDVRFDVGAHYIALISIVVLHPTLSVVRINSETFLMPYYMVNTMLSRRGKKLSHLTVGPFSDEILSPLRSNRIHGYASAWFIEDDMLMLRCKRLAELPSP